MFKWDDVIGRQHLGTNAWYEQSTRIAHLHYPVLYGDLTPWLGMLVQYSVCKL